MCWARLPGEQTCRAMGTVGGPEASFASQGGLSLGVGKGPQAGFRPLGWSGEPSCTFLLSLKSLSCQFLEKVLLKVLSFFLEKE